MGGNGVFMIMENDRLIMHNLTDRDLDGLKAMRCAPRIYRYEPTFLAELQGTPEEVLNMLQRMDLYRDRQCILGVYEKQAPDILTGLAEFYDYKTSGNVISIGYRFLPAYWGRGLATSCTQALLDYVMHETEVTLVTAHVIPENKASSKCLLKNGFEYLLTKTEDWGHERPCSADVYTFDCERR